MIIERIFNIGEVSDFAGVSRDSINNWLRRSLVVGHRDIKGGGHGVRREFSWSNLMEMAVAGALLDVGVASPAHAFAAAVRFSHVGDEARIPGLPFPHELGETFLFVSGDRSVVVLIDAGKIDAHQIRHALGGADGFICVNVSELFMRITQRIGSGFDYRRILDAAYADRKEG